MKANRITQKILSLALAVILAIAVLSPIKANATYDILSKLPYNNIVVGNLKYSDCVGKVNIIICGASGTKEDAVYSTAIGDTVPALQFYNNIIEENNLQGKMNILFIDDEIISVKSSEQTRTFIKETGTKNVVAFNANGSEVFTAAYFSGFSGSWQYPYILIISSSGEIVKGISYANYKLTDAVADISELISNGAGSVNMEIPKASIPVSFALNQELFNTNRTDRAAQIYFRDYNLDKIDANVKNRAEQITININDDYEKIRAINNWIASNIYYDYDDYLGKTKNNVYDSMTVLTTRKSICEGYKNLMIDMLRSIGIPAKAVVGYASWYEAVLPTIAERSHNHTWVEAFVDGRWIITDSTWDSLNEWRDGKISKSDGLRKDKSYFDIEVINFSTDHRIDEYRPDDSKIPTPSDWAIAEVNRANDLELVPDMLNLAYQSNTTRAQFCALTVKFYEIINGEITGRVVFTDTTDTNVEKAASIGVATGVGDNKFDPDAKLTREQAAVMLSRLTVAIGKPLNTQIPTFKDSGSVSSWAVDGVGQMQAAGIMSGTGDNYFSPLQPYTNEQSIMTILRLYDAV